jgi:hypothetical protein
MATLQQLMTPRRPSPGEPFGLFVVHSMHHRNAGVFADVLTICATLYLSRGNPDLLRRFCRFWAKFFSDIHQHMEIELREEISRGNLCHNPSGPLTLATPSTECAIMDAMNEVANQNPKTRENEEEEEDVGRHCDVPHNGGCTSSVAVEERIDHLLRFVHYLVGIYFGCNWNMADRIVTLNREYITFVTDTLIPVAVLWLDCGSIEELNRKRQSYSGSGDTKALESSASISAVSNVSLCNAWTPSSACALTEDPHPFHLLSLAKNLPETDSSGSAVTAVTRATQETLPQLLNEAHGGIFLYFHAEFNQQSCRALQLFLDIAQRWANEHRDNTPAFAVVTAVTEMQLVRDYQILWFPTIVFILAGKDTHRASESHIKYPENAVMKVDALEEWMRNLGSVPPRLKRFKTYVSKFTLIARQQKFRPLRDLQSACVMLRQLQCIDDCPGELSKCSAEDPPVFVFLGGGMAAGKTTSATALTHSEWWKSHKDSAVVVDADVFKQADIMYGSGRDSMDIHKKSVEYSQQLLVAAINQGRSVIFDGTMSWLPYVAQTVDMVRSAHEYKFALGRGYRPVEAVEEYWVRSEKRTEPLTEPYRIRFFAITVEPDEAVPRGIIRHITTGRGVPIASQLRSFRLFASAFLSYAGMCDEVTLFNNNVRVDLEKGELPPVIAERRANDAEVGDPKYADLRIHDPVAFRMFLRHSEINDNATCAEEIFNLGKLP